MKKCDIILYHNIFYWQSVIWDRAIFFINKYMIFILIFLYILFVIDCLVVCSMVFNVTFNNILVILWQSVLLVEETGENHWPVASQGQTLLHNVLSNTPLHEQGSNSQLQWWSTLIAQGVVNPTTTRSQPWWPLFIIEGLFLTVRWRTSIEVLFLLKPHQWGNG